MVGLGQGRNGYGRDISRLLFCVISSIILPPTLGGAHYGAQQNYIYPHREKKLINKPSRISSNSMLSWKSNRLGIQFYRWAGPGLFSKVDLMAQQSKFEFTRVVAYDLLSDRHKCHIYEFTVRRGFGWLSSRALIPSGDSGGSSRILSTLRTSWRSS